MPHPAGVQAIIDRVRQDGTDVTHLPVGVQQPVTDLRAEVWPSRGWSLKYGEYHPEAVDPGPQIVTDGLVAHWPFNDGTGDTVTDVSGSGFHLQLGTTSGADANQPTWSATGVDCILDESENGIIANSDLGLFTGVTDKTVIFVTQAKIATNSWRLFGIPGGGLDNHMQIYNTGQLIRVERGFGQGVDTALSLIDETWHVVALTQDGTNTFEETTVYLDGSSEVLSFFSNVIAPDGNLFLASFDGNGQSKWIKYAYGLVYDRALSAAEIAQNRTALTAILAARGITLP